MKIDQVNNGRIVIMDNTFTVLSSIKAVSISLYQEKMIYLYYAFILKEIRNAFSIYIRRRS